MSTVVIEPTAPEPPQPQPPSAQPPPTRRRRYPKPPRSSRITIGNPNNRRERGSPYTPGQFDLLLPPKQHAPSTELRGCSIELATSGQSVVVAEMTIAGSTPRHLIREYPYYIDLTLASGEQIQIEVRKFAPLEDPFDEQPTPQTEAAEPRSLADLLLFGVTIEH